jgi:hypothetical protein
MDIKDQYLELCEARVEALANEVRLLKEFIIRDYSLKGISAESAMNLFKAFKESNEDSNQD